MYKAFYAGHIGFSKTFEEDVETAVKFGYEGVHIDIVGLSDRDPAEIREILAKNNLKPGGFVLPVNYREGQDVLRPICRNCRNTANLHVRLAISDA